MKALFFDIDGTLVSLHTHCIPDSAVEALHLAKKKGNKIFISTGRPHRLIDNIDSIKDIIDGYITANGSYCFVDDVVTLSHPVPPEDVRTLIKLADRYDFSCMIAGDKNIAVYRDKEEVDKFLKATLNVSDFRRDISVEAILDENVFQLSPFTTPDIDDIMNPLLKGSIAMRWCPYFTDVFSIKANKAIGLESIMKYCHLDRKDTMAFGDGENDIPIIKYAGTGVALGNTSAEVRASADYVTSPVEEDGIAMALKHFGVI